MSHCSGPLACALLPALVKEGYHYENSRSVFQCIDDNEFCLDANLCQRDLSALETWLGEQHTCIRQVFLALTDDAACCSLLSALVAACARAPSPLSVFAVHLVLDGGGDGSALAEALEKSPWRCDTLEVAVSVDPLPCLLLLPPQSESEQRLRKLLLPFLGGCRVRYRLAGTACSQVLCGKVSPARSLPLSQLPLQEVRSLQLHSSLPLWLAQCRLPQLVELRLGGACAVDLAQLWSVALSLEHAAPNLGYLELMAPVSLELSVSHYLALERADPREATRMIEAHKWLSLIAQNLADVDAEEAADLRPPWEIFSGIVHCVKLQCTRGGPSAAAAASAPPRHALSCPLLTEQREEKYRASSLRVGLEGPNMVSLSVCVEGRRPEREHRCCCLCEPWTEPALSTVWSLPRSAAIVKSVELGPPAVRCHTLSEEANELLAKCVGVARVLGVTCLRGGQDVEPILRTAAAKQSRVCRLSYDVLRAWTSRSDVLHGSRSAQAAAKLIGLPRFHGFRSAVPLQEHHLYQSWASMNDNFVEGLGVTVPCPEAVCRLTLSLANRTDCHALTHLHCSSGGAKCLQRTLATRARVVYVELANFVAAAAEKMGSEENALLSRKVVQDMAASWPATGNDGAQLDMERLLGDWKWDPVFLSSLRKAMSWPTEMQAVQSARSVITALRAKI